MHSEHLNKYNVVVFGKCSVVKERSLNVVVVLPSVLMSKNRHHSTYPLSYVTVN